MEGRSVRGKVAILAVLLFSVLGSILGAAVFSTLMFLTFGGVNLAISAWNGEMVGFHWHALIACVIGLAVGFPLGGQLCWYVIRRTKFLTENEISEAAASWQRH